MLSGEVFSMTQEDFLGEPVRFSYGDEMTTFYRATTNQNSKAKFVYYTCSDKVPFYPTGELYAEIHDQSNNTLKYLLKKYHLECKESRGDGVYILGVELLEDPVKIAESIYKKKKPEIDAIEPKFSTAISNACIF